MRLKSFKIKLPQASISKFVKQYWVDESGSTAIEYGLITALISVMLISAASALGGSLSEMVPEISLLLSGAPEIPQANSVS